MKKFRAKREDRECRNNRRTHKSTRTKTRAMLTGLSGEIERESEYNIRERVCSLAAIYGMQNEAAKARRYQRAAVTAMASRLVGEGAYYVDDVDSYGDPYFDHDDVIGVDPTWGESVNVDDQMISFVLQEERPVALNRYEVNFLEQDKMPMSKARNTELVIKGLLSWLDSQVGKPYHEICAEAQRLSGKNWWKVRQEIIGLCATNGRPYRPFYVNNEGILWPMAKEKSKYIVIPTEVYNWVGDRKIEIRGAHLFWCVPEETTAYVREPAPGGGIWLSWKLRKFATTFRGYRQDRELNEAEMQFFASLSPEVQTEVLTGKHID